MNERKFIYCRKRAPNQSLRSIYHSSRTESAVICRITIVAAAADVVVRIINAIEKKKTRESQMTKNT